MRYVFAYACRRLTEISFSDCRYSGLSERCIVQHNLAVPPDFYWKELLRDEGFTVGRLDSRYKGIDRQDAGNSVDYNAEMGAWSHEFAPAFNQYIRSTLGFKTDLQYLLFGPVHPWDSVGDTYRQDQGGEKLRIAMAQNPFMHVLTQVHLPAPINLYRNMISRDVF